MLRIRLESQRYLQGLLLALGMVLLLFACGKIEDDVLFTGDEYQNIFQYIEEHKETYSSFLEIIEVGRMKDVLSSYNSNVGGDGFTLFLPDNEAVNSFINTSSQFSSLDELLQDSLFVKELVKYHVVNVEVNSVDFPNGALSDKTLSNDFLTVKFIDQGDEVLYSINGEAVVIQRNIQKSNGIIHQIDKMLLPVVYTGYQWIQVKKDNGFQIFSDLLEITGLEDTLNYYEVDELNQRVYTEYTLFAESDELYQQNGILSIDNLISLIGPDDTEYTNKVNKLNKFARYHIINQSVFIDEFQSNIYNTYGDYPIDVDFEKDLHFNSGSDVYETLIVGEDTIEIDYINIDLDRSNIVTKTGPIHQLDRILHPFLPGRKTETFQFYTEVEIDKLKNTMGSVDIRKEDLNTIELFGTDFLTYTKTGSTDGLSNNDFITVKGNFEFTYTTPKILAGPYEVKINAHRASTKNATIQVYLDGKKLGTIVDLTSGSSNNDYSPSFELGTVEFEDYSSHEIKLRAIVPGLMKLDWIRFEL